MSLAGIFPSVGGVAMPRLITENPMVQGYREEDRFLRGQARDAAYLDRTRFDLDEMRRKSSEAQGLDAAQRETLADLAGRWGLGAATAVDTTVHGPVSQSAARPDTPGRVDPSYTTAELPAPAPNLTPGLRPNGEPESVFSEPGLGIYDRGASGFEPAPGYEGRVRGTENTPGNPFARNPRSSAMGDGQFLDGTWLEVWPRIANLPEVKEALRRRNIDATLLHDRNDILSMRGIPEVSDAATREYGRMNGAGLRSTLGRDPSDGELRLAHGFGPIGARTLLAADPGAPVEAVLGEKVMAANPNLAGKTVGEVVRQYDSRRGFAPAPAAPAQPPGNPLAHLAQGFGIDPSAAMGRPVQVAQTAPAPGATMTDAPNNVFGIDGPAASGRPIVLGQSGVSPARGAAANAGTGLDLTRRFSDPRIRAYVERLSRTPGGGAALEKLVTGELGERDRLGLKVFDLANLGQVDLAALLARSLKLDIDPRTLRNPAAVKHLQEIAKLLAAGDPVYGARYGGALSQTGDPGAAFRAAGTPTPKRAFQPVTLNGESGGSELGAFDPTTGGVSRTGVAGYAGGRGGVQSRPAEAQMLDLLVEKGIAADHRDAWAKLRQARNDPARLYIDAVKAFSNDFTNPRSPEETAAAARQLVEEALRFSQAQSGGLRSLTPPEPPSTTPTIGGASTLVPGGAAAYQMPGPGDPLGMR